MDRGDWAGHRPLGCRVEHDWTIKHTHTLIPYLYVIVFSLECLQGLSSIKWHPGLSTKPMLLSQGPKLVLLSGLRYKVLYVRTASTISLAAGTIYLNTPETHCTNTHCSGMLESKQCCLVASNVLIYTSCKSAVEAQHNHSTQAHKQL